MFNRILAAFALCLVLAGCAAPHAGTGQVITETFMIPALDPGIQLHVRNKRAAGQTQFSPERVVLFVQPAHADRLEMLDKLGYWDAFERWKRAITLRVARARGENVSPVWTTFAPGKWTMTSPSV